MTRRLLIALLCVSLLLACLPIAAWAAEAGADERLEVTAFWRDTLNPPSGRMLEYIENKFNIKFTTIIVPNPEYTNRRNLALASGDLPDIFQTMGPDELDYMQMLDEGNIIMELDPYLEDAPNLKKWLDSDEAKLYTLYDRSGHYTGIPRGYCYYSAANYYRQDLLEKHGLSVPVTVEEYIETITALSKAEGKYGIITGGIDGFSSFVGSFNGFGMTGFVEKDGKYSDVAIWPETREALGHLAKMYADGAIHPEFVLIGDVDTFIQKFVTGDALTMFLHVEANYFYDRIVKEGEAQIPGADIVAGYPLKGPGGYASGFPSLPFSTNMHINAKTDPEKARRIVAMFDFLFSPDGYAFNEFGIPDIHYTLDDNGERIINMDEVLKDTPNPAADALSKWRWYSDIMPGAIPAQSIDVEIQKSIFEFNQEAMKNNYSRVVGFSSPNRTIIEPALNDLRKEYFIKFVTGELNLEAGWDEFLNLYNEAGYLTLEAEVNEFMAN